MTTETKDIAYDPTAGAGAFAETKPEFDALRESELEVIAGNIEYAAPALLNIAKLVQKPELRAQFERMPRFDLRHLDGLPRYVWAAWFARVKQNDANPGGKRVQVDPVLLSSARERRRRMLTLLEYHFDDDPSVEAVLASIRAGKGFRDLAMDLTHLAGLYERHRSVIETDNKNYRAEDEAAARREAQALLTEVGDAVNDPATQDYRRAWTLLGRAYASVRTAYLYLHHGEPEAERELPALFALARRPRRRAAPAANEPAMV